MKIDQDKNGTPIIREVFSGAFIETRDGNRIGFCMRDDTIEFNVLPKSGQSKWYRVDMQSLRVDPMDAFGSTGPKDKPDPA